MSKHFHVFTVDAIQLAKEEIFSINAVDKKGLVGDWLVTYEDGTRAILTNAEAKKQLATEDGEIDDRSHVVNAEEAAHEANKELGLVHGQVILLPLEGFKEIAEEPEQKKVKKDNKVDALHININANGLQKDDTIVE